MSSLPKYTNTLIAPAAWTKKLVSYKNFFFKNTESEAIYTPMLHMNSGTHASTEWYTL